MLSVSDAVDAPELVHFLPIATTAVSLAFLLVLLLRARVRSWPPHLMWWAAGVLFYGAGTALESTITLMGNSPALTRWWYVMGALLGGYPLGTGSVYLLCRTRVAHVLTAISGSLVLLLAVVVLASPIDGDLLQPHRPSGDVLVWSWVRWGTPFVNLYAAVFLIGGAVHSAVRFWFPVAGAARDGRRAVGTTAIALGGLLPGIGGGLAKAGIVEALYVGEFVGLCAIWAGHALCASSSRDRDGSSTRAVAATVATPPAGAHGNLGA